MAVEHHRKHGRDQGIHQRLVAAFIGFHPLAIAVWTERMPT